MDVRGVGSRGSLQPTSAGTLRGMAQYRIYQLDHADHVTAGYSVECCAPLAGCWNGSPQERLKFGEVRDASAACVRADLGCDCAIDGLRDLRRANCGRRHKPERVTLIRVTLDMEAVG